MYKYKVYLQGCRHVPGTKTMGAIGRRVDLWILERSRSLVNRIVQPSHLIGIGNVGRVVLVMVELRARQNQSSGQNEAEA